MSKLQTYYHFKLDFQKVDQHTGGKWLIHGIKSCKDNQLQSQELPCRISNRECKHDIKDSEGNMFNPISKENVQGWKHPGSCTFAEPELLSYKKLKRVVQDEKNGHKNPKNNHNYHDENLDVIKLYRGNSKRSTWRHSKTEQCTATHPKTSPIDCSCLG